MRNNPYFYDQWVREVIANKKRAGQEPGLFNPPSAWDTSINIASFTYSNTNHTATKITAAGGGPRVVMGTKGRGTGQYYFEVTNTSGVVLIGVGKASIPLTSNLGFSADGWGYRGGNGNAFTGNVNTAYGAAYAPGDVIGVMVDLTAHSLKFSLNGVDQGVAFTNLSGVVFPAASLQPNGSNGTIATTIAGFQFFPGVPYAAWD